MLPVIFATTLTSIMGNSLLSPAIPDILDAFGRPDSAAGFLVASASLPGIVVAPMIGLLADRWGRRNILVPCLALFGVAGLFVAAAPTFGAMLAGRLIMGLGAAGLVNLAVVLIGDVFPDQDDRTHWIGRNAGVLTLALALFPVMAGFITDVAGWRWALAPYGLGAVTAVAAWFVLGSAEQRPSSTIRAQLAGLRSALRDPTIVVTLAGGALAFAVMFGVFLAVLPSHLQDDFGLGPGWRGIVIGLPALTSSLAAFNLGRIRNRIAVRTVLIATAATWVFAFTLIGLSTVLVLLLVGTLLYGVGEGLLIPSLQDIAIRRAPDEQRAAVLATWTGFARFGQTVGPLVAGAIVAGGGTTWALMSGAIGAAGMLMMFLLNPIPAPDQRRVRGDDVAPRHP